MPDTDGSKEQPGTEGTPLREWVAFLLASLLIVIGLHLCESTYPPLTHAHAAESFLLDRTIMNWEAQAVRFSAERDSLFDRWGALGYDYGFDSTLLWEVLALFAAIVLAMIVWNQRLSREIRQRKEAEAALRESETRMKDIVDNVGAHIFIKDTQYRYTYVNNKVCELFGRLEQDILGQSDAAFFSGASVEEILRSDRLVIEQEQTVEREEKALVSSDTLPRTYWSVKIPLRDTTGRICGLCGIATDITERKRAELILREEEVRRRTLMDQSRDGIVILDQDGGVFEANRAFAAMLGYSIEEMAHLHVWDWDAQMTREDLEEAIRILDPAGDHFITRHRRRDGSVYDVEITTTAAVWEGQKLILCVCRDVSERLKAEEALQENEEQFKAMFEMASIGMAQADPKTGQWLRVNPKLCEITGYSATEMLSMRISQLTHPDDRERDRETFQRVVGGAARNYRLEKRYIRKDGSEVWVSVNMAVIRDATGQPVRAIATIEDITERKRAEETLEKRLVALTCPLDDTAAITFEDLFNLEDIQRLQNEFAEATGVASIITRPDGTPITEPSNFCRLCRDIIRKTDKGRANCYRSDALLGQLSGRGPTVRPCMSAGLWGAGAGISVGGRPIANWVIGQVRDETQTEEKMRAYAREVGADEEEAIKAFGEMTAMTRERFTRVAQVLFTLANQLSATAYQNVRQARFIAERKRAEEALAHSHDLMRYIIEHSRSAIAVHDRDLKYIYVSQRYLQDYNVTEPDVIGKHHYEVFPDLPQKWRDVHREALAGKVSRSDDDPYIRADGSVEWTRWECRPWYEADGSIGGIIVYTEVITERRRVEEERERLQAQLNQAQKLESVGRLAGGVAHDFNNMLSVILGHTEMALEQVDPAQPLFADLQEIRKAADRSASLTRQLLAFARKQTIAPKVLDLNETVSGMLKMLQRLIGEDIHLAWLPGADLWPVKIDPTQIDQILANLSVNARDAIAGVGKVTIETENRSFDAAYASDHPGVFPGEYVLLAVSDDGCGMDGETLGKLFEPFFTTKGVGQGTGLGLATVYGIVKQNGGFVNVYSEPGRGTTFRIYLPRRKHKTDQKIEPSGGQAGGGHETILLVEDESTILNMTHRMLERLGYSVLAAGTPGEALRLAEVYAGEIHLLMTDVVMPEMNGRDLAKNLLSLYPNLKRLFMSGYTANVIAHHGVLEPGVHFIQKPFSMQDLAARLRTALDEKDS